MARKPDRDQATLDFEGREGRPAHTRRSIGKTGAGARLAAMREAVASYYATHSVKETGQRFGCSVATIYDFLVREGIPRHPTGKLLRRPDCHTPVEQERWIVSEYVAGRDVASIAEQAGVHFATVYKILKRNCVTLRPRVEPIDVESAGSRYEAGEKARSIAESFGVCVHVVLKSLREAGIPIRKGGNVAKIEREDAFAEIDEYSAYWAGFIMADGCVADPPGRSKRLIVTLQAGDRGHLVKLAGFLGSTNRISTKNMHVCGRGNRVRDGCKCSEDEKSQNVRPYSTLAVSSDRIASDLEAFGVTPRKTLACSAKGVEMNRQFWRGVIDGDGSIGFVASQRLPVISLVGSEALIYQFLAFAKSVRPECMASARRVGNVHTVKLKGSLAWDLIDILYREAPVSLDRKHGRAIEILSLRRPTPRVR